MATPPPLHQLSIPQIAERLSNGLPGGAGNPYPAAVLRGPARKAAVLVPLVCDADGWHLMFIRRTTNLRDRHSGQVAFPGGGMEPGDSTPLQVALRETYEEVGILPEDVRVLGKMSERISISNYQVAPFVGAVPWPYALRPDPREVSRVFTIPLAWLMDPQNREVRTRVVPPFKPFEVVYFEQYDGELLWGFSARLTVDLIAALGGSPQK